MTFLISGLALWVLAHLFKRLAPGPRERLGDAGKGVVALGILAGLVLMVIGYRRADTEFLYALPEWARHVNNLLMYGAVVLFGMGSSKGRMRSWLRHPMLTGVIVWAVAHLLVNGDTASLVLFGGLAIWAVVEILVINAKADPWQRPEPGSASRDIRLLIIAAVLYVVIAAIHSWLGYWPFPG